ncbi:MAG: hypothetical protein SGILL_001201 [Bacillariaceae sp.]
MSGNPNFSQHSAAGSSTSASFDASNGATHSNNNDNNARNSSHSNSDFNDFVASTSMETPVSVTSAERSAANAVALAKARMLPTVTTQKRMQQLFEEGDHKRCSEGNRKALLAEHLEQLRGIVKVLEADDWKFAAPMSAAASSNFRGEARFELGNPVDGDLDLPSDLGLGIGGGGGTTSRRRR